jgi:hypothetical protein
MPGLVPGIHVFVRFPSKTWLAGTSPAMTRRGWQELETRRESAIAASTGQRIYDAWRRGQGLAAIGSDVSPKQGSGAGK